MYKSFNQKEKEMRDTRKNEKIEYKGKEVESEEKNH